MHPYVCRIDVTMSSNSLSKTTSRMASRNYENLHPEMVVPDCFFIGSESTIVAIYSKPLEDVKSMTLEFPGDVTGSAVTCTPLKYVEPRRVGSQTIVFKTPVYESAHRGVVEIHPLVVLTNGERVELSTFKILLKHPIRSVMELCMNHSTNESVLPVLVSLMVHCQTDPKDSSTAKDRFKDPHIDRIMSTLVGSRSPYLSSSIEDIMLPSKKWKKMSLVDFAREFGLSSMEKQAYDLLKKRHVKQQHSRAIPARHEFTTSNLEVQQSHSDMDIHKAVNQETQDIQSLIKNAKCLSRVVKGYKAKRPDHLSLAVGQMVYVVSTDEDCDQITTATWYGVCENKCGYFPSKCVEYVRQIKRERRHSTNVDGQVQCDIERSNTLRGQNITSDELKRHPIHQYANIVPISTEDSLSVNSHIDSPQMSHPCLPKFKILPGTEYLSGTQSDGDASSPNTMVHAKVRAKIVKMPVQVPHVMKVALSPPNSKPKISTSSHSHSYGNYDNSTGDNTDSSADGQICSEEETHDEEQSTCKQSIVADKRPAEQPVLERARMGLGKKIRPNPPPRIPRKISLCAQHQDEPTLQLQPQTVNKQLKKKPLPLPVKKSNKHVVLTPTSTEDNSDTSDYEDLSSGVLPLDEPSCSDDVQYVNFSETELVEDHLYDLPQLPGQHLGAKALNQSQQSGFWNKVGYHDTEPTPHDQPSKQAQFQNLPQNVSRRQNIMQSTQHQVPPRNVYRHGIQHAGNTSEEIPISMSSSKPCLKKAKKPIPPPKHATPKKIQHNTVKEQGFGKNKGVPTPFTHL